MSYFRNLVIFFLVLSWSSGTCQGNLSVQAKECHFNKLIQESHPNLQVIIKEGIGSISGQSVDEDQLHFAPLGGGMSHSKLFVFSLENHQYVLRIIDPRGKERKETRIKEVLAQKAAASIGIAPEVIYSDPEGLIMIMRYIDGHPLTKRDLKEKKLVQNLGTTLRRLHQIRIALPTKRTQFDRADKHYRRIKEKGIALPSNFSTLYDTYIQETRGFTGNDVLCHEDLNPGNILVQNGTPFLIDWTGASYDHPYTDIGYLTLMSGMNQDQTLVLFEEYLERKPTQDELKKVKLAQARVCLLAALVWFDFSETDEEIKNRKEERIRFLDQQLNSPTLKTGHEYILEGIVVNPFSAPKEEVRKFALGFLKEYLIRREEMGLEDRASENEEGNGKNEFKNLGI